MQQFLPLILLAGVMYVALILPQQRRTKEHRALLAGIQENDEVVLNSGIHGFITQLEPDVVWLEVAPNVELKVSRSAIANKVRATDESEPPAGKVEKVDKAGKADKAVDAGADKPADKDTAEG